MKTNLYVDSDTLQLICHFESLHDGDLKKIGCQPKMDPVGIWTVGYGHALVNKTTGKFLRGEKDRALAYRMFPSLTEPQAKALLLGDLPMYEDAVLRMIKRRDLQPHEYGPLVSFAYNCGTHYTNKFGIKVPFALWKHVDNRMDSVTLYNYWQTSVIKAGGEVLPGLVRRRKAEAWLFTRGILKLY